MSLDRFLCWPQGRFLVAKAQQMGFHQHSVHNLLKTRVNPVQQEYILYNTSKSLQNKSKRPGLCIFRGKTLSAEEGATLALLPA